VKSIGDIYLGWVANVWKKEDADAHIIRLQKYIIAMLFVLGLSFFVGWITAPSRMTVYIPPDIQNGATLKAGAIPESLIYSYTYEIWQKLNYWSGEDADEYQKNIRSYWSYLTPGFRADLLEEFAELKATGQVMRSRSLQGISGAAYEPVNIRKIGSNSWEVRLRMRLTESRNNQVVKDVEILYPLIVTRVNISHENNPYGLALAGFGSAPERERTHV